ncbi:MAG: transcriptional regulator, PucR family [Blastococcus sp.]|nr:transcriptional regulator, PucR family [Blastococcus sp.]
MSSPRHRGPVLIPLSQVLSLPEVAAASPAVLLGDPDRTLIRWVHSSEVFEMGPLLTGGELLLTTGLGLRGTSAAAQEQYVEALAEAGLATLALELGRTFSEVPEPLLRAAARRHLTVISLREVVPFAVIVEAFHRLEMDREVAGLRRGERIWRELTGGVLDRGGLHALVRRIADLAGGKAFLVARDGRLVAASHPATVAPEATRENSRPVEVEGTSWGTLILDTRRGQLRSAVLDRAPHVVALELGHASIAQDGVALASALLYDLVHDRLPSVEELHARSEIAGFPSARGRPLVAISVAGDRRVQRALLSSSAQRACTEVFGVCLVGEVDEEVVMVVRVPRGGDARLRERLDLLSGKLSDAMERTTGHSIIAVTAGSPVEEMDELARSIAQSREVAAIARRLGTHRGAMLARDLGIYRLLAQLQSGPELSVFLREQLGPLLDHDAAHGTELLRTLDAYLRHGLAKTETAGALGVRRQTLYNRLTRIDELLGGGPLSDYERRTALSVALHAWQLRTGLHPGHRLTPSAG